MYYLIPNWIVLPAIVIGIMRTGHWETALAMFLIGALLYNKKKICGGDVKLMAMCGAFLGLWALPAFMLSRIYVKLYRKKKDYNGMLPYAPFLGISCIPFLFL